MTASINCTIEKRSGISIRIGCRMIHSKAIMMLTRRRLTTSARTSPTNGGIGRRSSDGIGISGRSSRHILVVLHVLLLLMHHLHHDMLRILVRNERRLRNRRRSRSSWTPVEPIRTRIGHHRRRRSHEFRRGLVVHAVLAIAAAYRMWVMLFLIAVRDWAAWAARGAWWATRVVVVMVVVSVVVVVCGAAWWWVFTSCCVDF